VGRVTTPAVVASLPVLCLLVWVSTAYGHVFPTEGPPPVRVIPERFQATWVAQPDGPPRILITDEQHQPVAEVPVRAPVPVVEKWRWWNVLAGNPAGYLDAANPAQRLDITLPRLECLPVGPDWLRGWEFTFFAAVIVMSLLLKRVLRIH
jgi:hypothetical protein